MENNTFAKHPTFYAVGLSYKKADAEMRGKFSLDEKAKTNLLHQAKDEGIDSLIVTSTCNRTEIYGFAQHPFQLIKLFLPILLTMTTLPMQILQTFFMSGFKETYLRYSKVFFNEQKYLRVRNWLRQHIGMEVGSKQNSFSWKE